MYPVRGGRVQPILSDGTLGCPSGRRLLSVGSVAWLGLAVPVLGFTTSAQVECLRIITPPNPKPCRKTQLLTCIESFGPFVLRV